MIMNPAHFQKYGWDHAVVKKILAYIFLSIILLGSFITVILSSVIVYDILQAIFFAVVIVPNIILVRIGGIIGVVLALQGFFNQLYSPLVKLKDMLMKEYHCNRSFVPKNPIELTWRDFHTIRQEAWVGVEWKKNIYILTITVGSITLLLLVFSSFKSENTSVVNYFSDFVITFIITTLPKILELIFQLSTLSNTSIEGKLKDGMNRFHQKYQSTKPKDSLVLSIPMIQERDSESVILISDIS